MRRLLLAALLLGALGCADDVDPTLGIDAPFSLYGYLDPTADRQLVRVAPITDTIAPDTAAIDAAVTTTDLSTGAVTAWRDSLVTFSDGSQGWVFVGDTTPRPGARYRVEAARSDGSTASTEVTVPDLLAATVGTATPRTGDAVYPVRFDGAPRVMAGRLQLILLEDPDGPNERVVVGTVPTPVQPRELAPGQWEAAVPFVDSARRYFEAEGLDPGSFRLVACSYSAFVADAGWTPPLADLDALAEPGTFSNVTGGFGFVGSGYITQVTWTPALAYQLLAGLAADGDQVVREVAINEVSVDEDWIEFYNPLQTDVDLRGYALAIEGARDLQRIPSGFVVPAGDFVVLDLTIDAIPDTVLVLTNRRGDVVERYEIQNLSGDVPGGVTYGSFPDGLSFPLPQSDDNLFRGALTPTPGRPNEIGLDIAFVNEVYTEGANGWVEVVPGDGRYDASRAVVFDRPDRYPDGVAVAIDPYASADERAVGLSLGQTGGTVYLVVRYYEPRIGGTPPPGAPPIRWTRVVDVRAYGPQTPGRSSGYLGVPPRAPWRTDLAPTRGTPNAAARLGL